MVDEIHDNGELDKYWLDAEKKNEQARRAARKLEKERKRLELGSAYETTGSTDEDPWANVDGSDFEDEWEEEESEYSEDEGVPNMTEEERAERHKARVKARAEEKRLKEEEEMKNRFNPIKFLAETLKEIKD